ncbi:3-hydroxyisobutyryl-CoA hydrolase 1-like [Mercurialis annua]|uniref:3-hydroxyisobutyryl-CoA hydrolase 1-like n=1 Tax=Mercurialis annua TaxID=3986 RepID=UPI0024AE993D|nr:3-hydroxyisobutyryl-CoA hydrolase 1-like [Mercurialis annua]
MSFSPQKKPFFKVARLIHAVININYICKILQVIFEGDSIFRKVILNRPNKFNSLSYEMVSQMLKNLRTFEMDSSVKFVILKANGKAFCAGGDVVSILGSMMTGHWSFGARFYKKQLNLHYLIATYKKPLIPFIDGIVMGGGAGLSMHGRFKIVTEKTVIAMPEAALGLFSDVGASHFLSRLPGHFGEYLGLTGARLNGVEMLACGLASHFVLSKDLPSLENALQTLTSFENASIHEVIHKFSQTPNLKDDSIYKRLEIIKECFSKDRVEEILLSLENEAKMKEENWITMAIKSIKSASPLSLKITLKSIREGRQLNLKQCLIRDYTIFCNISRATVNKDFYEGSRAMLFDKDKKPKWEPPILKMVSEDMVDRCFAAINDDDWKYLKLPPSRLEFFKSKL